MKTKTPDQIFKQWQRMAKLAKTKTNIERLKRATFTSNDTRKLNCSIIALRNYYLSGFRKDSTEIFNTSGTESVLKHIPRRLSCGMSLSRVSADAHRSRMSHFRQQCTE